MMNDGQGLVEGVLSAEMVGVLVADSQQARDSGLYGAGSTSTRCTLIQPSVRSY